MYGFDFSQSVGKYSQSYFSNSANRTTIIPTTDSDDDDDQTVRTSNCFKNTHGLLDLGASDHFLAIHSQVESSWPTTNKINVVIPDGEKMLSTKECNIDWPALPKSARHGHIIPSLKNYVLISVVKLCDAGCQVLFKYDCCLVIYKGKIIMYGVRCPRT